MGARNPVTDPINLLTSQEQEVLQYLAQGKAAKEIAVALNMWVPTVEQLRKRIMLKLQLRRVQAAENEFLLSVFGQPAHSDEVTDDELTKLLEVIPEGPTESDSEVDLIQRAAEVVGLDRLAKWMQTPIPSLKERTPYSLMGSEEGRKEVEMVLGAIEHGIY